MIFRITNSGAASDLRRYIEDLRTEGFDIECKGEEYNEIYYIEIKDLDQLMFLKRIVAEEIIITDAFNEEVDVIEIYDDYRE